MCTFDQIENTNIVSPLDFVVLVQGFRGIAWALMNVTAALWFLHCMICRCHSIPKGALVCISSILYQGVRSLVRRLCSPYVCNSSVYMVVRIPSGVAPLQERRGVCCKWGAGIQTPNSCGGRSRHWGAEGPRTLPRVVPGFGRRVPGLGQRSLTIDRFHKLRVDFLGVLTTRAPLASGLYRPTV